MKFPSVCSAHWEGAVGQWLRGQLDARGIDAPAYGRYVLSLLTRPLDPADLSPSPIGYKVWERRDYTDWPPVKIEALKRSAAVQCLLNASDDQNSGIEQLVDELCSKLKEVNEVNIQNDKKESQAMKTSRKERNRQLSPAEMERLYYAAFPALIPSNPNSNNITLIKQAPPSTSGVSCNFRNKDYFSNKTNTYGKDQSHSKKPNGCKERRNTFNSHRSHNRGNKKSYRIKYHKEELPEWVNEGDAWDIENHDLIGNLVKGTVNNEGCGIYNDMVVHDVPSSKRLYERDSDYFLNIEGEDMYSKTWITDENVKSPEKSLEEYESIAKFKAKFDHSLEAIWPKEHGKESVLSTDIHGTSSSSERMLNCYSADKLLPLSLTHSIWSNDESKAEWDNNEVILSKDYSQRFVPEVVGVKPVSDKNNIWQTDTELYNNESMEVIYNKLKPLNLHDTDETSYKFRSSNLNSNNLTTSSIKWTENNIEEPYSFSFEIHQLPVGTSIRSFNMLNHDSSCSSFTEVIPRAPSGYVGDSLKRKSHVGSLKFEITKSLNEIDDKDDEDLLTSIKTHFQPIKQDDLNSYADGMTFTVDSNLDCVKFSRSESGTMFLESDTEPPKQYMEYRKKGIDYSRLDICPSSNCFDEELSSNDLVLKFKVCQTEKAIQTDDTDLIQSNVICNDNDESHKLLAMPYSQYTASSNSVKFDKNSDNDNEIEALRVDWMQCEDCKLNNNQWVTGEYNSDQLNTAKIWSLDDNFCKSCSEEQAKVKTKKGFRKTKVFEDESARDWDELLSDLKYIHDLKSENDCQDYLFNLNENYCIAPTEISYSAADGNFIKSALKGQNTIDVEDVKAWLVDTNSKIESNTVGKILNESVLMYSNVEPHCEVCSEESTSSVFEDCWRVDRKRRHSAVNGRRKNIIGKLRCTLPAAALVPHLPFLPTVDRPLTR